MTKRTSNPPSTEPPVLRIRTPDDAVSAVPYLLGFHPAESMVALPFGPPALRRPATTASHAGPAVMRIDLPDPQRLESDLDPWCNQLLGAIALGGSAVLLVAYTADRDLAEAVVDRLQRLLADQGVRVQEALRVYDSTWWSLTCVDDECCPPEGVPFDPATSVFAAQATFEGHSAAASRADLAKEIAPVSGPARAALARAFRAADWELRREEAEFGGDVVDEQGRTLVREVLKAWRSGLLPLSDQALARLAVRVARIPVRDEAWRLIQDPWRATHRSLWAEVVRRAEAPYDVAPACLLAVSAFVDGDGTMARIALDRALDRVPDYSMALLLHELLDRVVPPAAMREMIETFDATSMADDATDD